MSLPYVSPSFSWSPVPQFLSRRSSRTPNHLVDQTRHRLRSRPLPPGDPLIATWSIWDTRCGLRAINYHHYVKIMGPRDCDRSRRLWDSRRLCNHVAIRNYVNIQIQLPNTFVREVVVINLINLPRATTTTTSRTKANPEPSCTRMHCSRLITCIVCVLHSYRRSSKA